MLLTPRQIESFNQRWEPDEAGCWIWFGTINQSGYGVVQIGSRSNNTIRKHPAHRVSYELLVGPIPEDKVLDHLCQVKLCVNPSHLEVVTQSTNASRWHEHKRGLVE